MSTGSDAVTGPLDAPAVAPVALAATRPLYWSIRRELWENRSVTVGPLMAALLVLLGFTIHFALTLPSRVASLSALASARQQDVISIPYSIAASVIILAAYLVGAFFCLDALYGERRDRSILFWKSLPVSDLTTVLSKAAVPLLVLPSMAFVLALATQLAMLLSSTAIVAGSGLSPAPLWTGLPLVEMTLVMIYGLTVHVLWHAPIYAWLLLVSAWARRLPLLWAVLTPVALGVLETIAFQTSSVCGLIKYRLGGAMTEAFDLPATGHGATIRLAELDPVGFLATPGLWLGLLFAAAFLFAAARLRRRAEPI